MIKHIPVLKKEVVELLKVGKNKNYVDCTFCQGGHSLEILRRNFPEGKVLAFEIDRELYLEAKKKFKTKRLILVNENFVELERVVKKLNFFPVHGILIDLGISSWHIEKSKRGFSFKRDEILDMRYDTKREITAKDVLNKFSKEKLKEIFEEFGEIKRSKKLAEFLVKRRPFERTFDLLFALNRFYLKEKNLVRKVFLALRIFVNEELENLKKVLPQAIRILEKEGRLAVISYHSLEDRIVKNFFKKEKEKIKIITKKPIVPSKEEIKINPRSRSAKLRVCEKI